MRRCMLLKSAGTFHRFQRVRSRKVDLRDTTATKSSHLRMKARSAHLPLALHTACHAMNSQGHWSTTAELDISESLRQFINCDRTIALLSAHQGPCCSAMQAPLVLQSTSKTCTPELGPLEQVAAA